MTDDLKLVERLRAHRPYNESPHGDGALVREAASAIERLVRERDEARKLLREHHDHHLAVGEIGLKDGEGGWIEIDNGAEYSDSGLYERTDAALSDTPREWRPAPRGGITADWWQISVLERRKRRAAEADRDRLVALVAEMRGIVAEAVEEFGCSIAQYHQNGPDYTLRAGTEVFEVSVLLDREGLIDRARALLSRTQEQVG